VVELCPAAPIGSVGVGPALEEQPDDFHVSLFILFVCTRSMVKRQQAVVFECRDPLD
jgi:hypothetical protein